MHLPTVKHPTSLQGLPLHSSCPRAAHWQAGSTASPLLDYSLQTLPTQTPQGKLQKVQARQHPPSHRELLQGQRKHLHPRRRGSIRIDTRSYERLPMFPPTSARYITRAGHSYAGVHRPAPTALSSCSACAVWIKTDKVCQADPNT